MVVKGDRLMPGTITAEVPGDKGHYRKVMVPPDVEALLRPFEAVPDGQYTG